MLMSAISMKRKDVPHVTTSVTNKIQSVGVGFDDIVFET